MAISDLELEEYSNLIKENEKANQELEKIKTEIAVYKKQGIELLKERGFNSMAEVSALDAQIEALEETIKSAIPEMKANIEKINQIKEEKERIMLG